MTNNDDSLYAEQSVIGGMIILEDPQSDLMQKVLAQLKPSNFYTMIHKQIFSTIKKLAMNNTYIDLVTVEAMFESDYGKGNDVFIYLARISKNTPSAANILSYSKIVREYSIERYAVLKLQDLIGNFTDRTQGDVYQRLGLIETTVNDISNASLRNENGGLKHVSDALSKWLDNREEILETGFDKNAVSTGIESLDDILGVKGMRRGSLNAVGARPKMGKTAFMMKIANHVGLNLNEAVAIFSMEMADVEVAERSITERTGINPSNFYRNTESLEQQGRTDQAFNDMIKSKVYIDDGAALTLKHIQAQSRKLRKENGSIGLICVDYLTLMEAEKADRNDLGYGAITKGLKNLAKELNCVILLLTQLNRGLENRPDKRPVPSDSRDTGQIEQDVSLWIGLYKNSVYDKEAPNTGLTEVIVGLNRDGETGTAFVYMEQGFHRGLSMIEGAKMKHEIDSVKIDNEKEEKNKIAFKRK